MDDGEDRLMTPAEVGALFRVDPKTVTRWAQAGKIGRIRTPGGHSRYRESEVRALLEGDPPDDPIIQRALQQSPAAHPPQAGREVPR